MNQGLTTNQAAELLAKNGENVLAQKKPKTYLQMLLAQLNEPMIYILMVAMAVSLFLHEVSDAIIVGAVIILNAVIGVVQEGKAQAALEALKKLSSPTALVRRDGVVTELPASQLVVGDIIILEAGRQIPADLKLIESINLKIEESALTGESVPVEKDAHYTPDDNAPLGDRLNCAYMTTSVTYGRGEGVVVATGMQTEIGKIARMINDADDQQTPLQKRLADLGKVLGAVAIVICIALFVLAIFQKRDVAEMLLTAISLAVAAVPEGLPAVVTIVLALGVQRLVKVNTIVRRLPSVETLGAVSVVCSDKTGTLTQNKMTVEKAYMLGETLSANDLDKDKHFELIRGFALCSDAERNDDGTSIGDPTEVALIDLAIKYGYTKTHLNSKAPRTDELAFDSERKMMTTLHKDENGTFSFTKGAMDEILRRSTSILTADGIKPITAADKTKIEAAASEMSNNALRVLGLARRLNPDSVAEEKLEFIGLVGMIDPPREEAKDAVKLFKDAGVRTVMITGDHIDTAFAIAKQLGIATTKEECLEGAKIDTMTDEEFAQKVDSLRVFARVSPEHKVKIVQALQAKGYIVSMTGDGVNDAPSLKTADIGVAMGITGTDVAKSAADMVLTDDNFATIEKAIEEGRGIYENIKKSIVFLLSSNFGEIISMFASILMGLAAPLKAIQILWVNLITDSLPGLALGVDTNDKKAIMSRPPRNPKESLFTKPDLIRTIGFGAFIAAITLFAYLCYPAKLAGSWAFADIARAFQAEGVLNHAQTYAFTVLGVSQLFYAICMRNSRGSIFSTNHLNNKMMIVAFALGYLLQIAVTEVGFLVNAFGTVALSGAEWGFLTLIAFSPIVLNEIIVIFGSWTKKHIV
ncbi:MAG: cation-translocating P-type ATPase [Clostridiales bacterium]|nr:cation-translocating P-type ATPase [Clostridiales bacterium]